MADANRQQHRCQHRRSARIVGGGQRSRLRWLAVAVVLLPARPAHAVDAKKVFNQRCTACHTFGKGVKVGPDLKGVTVRRQRPWLLKFIRSSQRVIASGDPVANDLFRTFKRQRMPDWTDLSPQDVSAILDWLAADGPEQKPADERDAELAGAAEVARARALFDGRTPLASGGLACGACHTVRDHDRRNGRHAGAGTDEHVPQVPRSRADVVSAASVHAAPAGARLGPLSRARGGVRAQGLPARGGARRLAVRHLPDHRSETRTDHERTCAQLSVSRLALPGVDAGGGRLRRPHAADQRSPARREARVAARAAGVRRRLAVARWAGRCSRPAHLAGLLFPRAVLAWTRTPWRAVRAGGGRVRRRPRRARGVHPRRVAAHARGRPRGGWSLLSDFADSVFLSLLFIGVASGLLAAGVHRWGSAWGVGHDGALRGVAGARAARRRPSSSTCRSWFACTCSRRSRAFAAFPATPAGVFPLVLGAPRARAGGARADRRRAARRRVVAQQAGGVAVAGARGALARRKPASTAARASRPARRPRWWQRRAAQRRRGVKQRGQGGLMRAARHRLRLRGARRGRRAARPRRHAHRRAPGLRARSSRSRSRTRSTPATTRSPACIATRPRAPAGTPASRRPACA